jgi:hypothetical protein
MEKPYAYPSNTTKPAKRRGIKNYFSAAMIEDAALCRFIPLLIMKDGRPWQRGCLGSPEKLSGVIMKPVGDPSNLPLMKR